MTTKITNDNITSVDAGKLTGTVADARFPATLPAASGANLTSIPTGNLSGTTGVANGGTGAATHTANNVLIGNGTSAITSVAPSTSGNVLTSNGSAWASTAPAGGGKVLQVLQSVQTAVVTTTSSSLVDVTGLSQAITPSSSSSKILILVNVNATADDSGSVFQLMRGSTEIFKGDTGDSGETVGSFSAYGSCQSSHHVSVASACFLDSPSTSSSTTFKLQWKVASGTNYLNRNRRDSGSSDTRLASSITIMEISS